MCKNCIFKGGSNKRHPIRTRISQSKSSLGHFLTLVDNLKKKIFSFHHFALIQRRFQGGCRGYQHPLYKSGGCVASPCLSTPLIYFPPFFTTTNILASDLVRDDHALGCLWGNFKLSNAYWAISPNWIWFSFDFLYLLALKPHLKLFFRYKKKIKVNSQFKKMY